MAIFYSVFVARSPGPSITIDCPKCNGKAVPAETFDYAETLELFFTIPVLRHRTAVVICSDCGREMHSRFRVEQLHEKRPDQINKSLVAQDKMLAVVVFFVAVFMVLCPFFNLVPAIILPIVSRRARRLWRVVSYVPLVASAALDVWMAREIMSGQL